VSKTSKLILGSLLLAIIGLVFSVMSLNEHAMMFIGKQLGLDPQSSFCNISAEMNCKAVNESSWSMLFGIPVAAYGVWFYLVFIGFLLILSDDSRFYEDEVFEITAFFSFIGTVTSLVLFYVSKFKVGVLCPLCLGVYAVNFIQLALVIVSRSRKGYLAGVKDGFWGLIGLALEMLSVNGKSRAPALRLLVAFIVLSGIAAINLRHTLSVRYLEKFSAEPDWSKEKETKVEVQLTPGINQDFAKGPENAELNLIEFADYECPACQAVSMILGELYKKYEGRVRFIFKDYPLDSTCNPNIKNSFHDNSCYAAFLARCAGTEGKFWEMNDHLFSVGVKSEGMSPAQLKEKMTEGVSLLGLDRAKIDSCLANPAVKEKILSDIKSGDAIGLEGTPTIFINGKRVRDISYDNLAAIFAEILDAKPAKSK
jgi:protein-disulfide isomerase/uncharacterized membrane protein